jgi:cytochrome c oxidase cbb3-type subunit 1
VNGKPEATAIRHALGWLVAGNAVGLYLALLLLMPDLQSGVWTYGRWMPVHLNLQLYGWTSLPLVAWLFSLFEIEKTRHSMWGQAAVWAWSAALAVGALHWLGGITSGKIFLDWQGGSLWALTAAQAILWGALAAAWHARRHAWSHAKRIGLLLSLIALAMVPVSLVFAASPAIYPPIDPSTGGPTGSSLLGSTLMVVGLMLILPRMVAPRIRKTRSMPMWIFFGISWLVFGVTEALGGTHRDAWQILPMLFLLPWAWWIPQDWKAFDWPQGSAVWRRAMFVWWALLVLSGVLMFQNGILDHLKFTQGLVAHTHLAMAGFTTSFCALLCVLISRRPLGSAKSVVAWHAAAVGMIAVLAAAGWQEGKNFQWMADAPLWRTVGFALRAGCGLVMLGASIHWLKTQGNS